MGYDWTAVRWWPHRGPAVGATHLFRFESVLAIHRIAFTAIQRTTESPLLRRGCRFGQLLLVIPKHLLYYQTNTCSWCKKLPNKWLKTNSEHRIKQRTSKTNVRPITAVLCVSKAYPFRRHWKACECAHNRSHRPHNLWLHCHRSTCTRSGQECCHDAPERIAQGLYQ